MKKCLLIFLINLVYNCGISHSQYILQGTIKDAETKLSIENVSVLIAEENIGNVSNKDGFFKLTIRKLPVTVTFRHVAYKDREVKFTTKDFSGNNEKTFNILNWSLFLMTM